MGRLTSKDIYGIWASMKMLKIKKNKLFIWFILKSKGCNI